VANFILIRFTGQNIPLTNLSKLAKKLKVTGQFQIEGCKKNKILNYDNFGLTEFSKTLDAFEILLFCCQKKDLILIFNQNNYI